MAPLKDNIEKRRFPVLTLVVIAGNAVLYGVRPESFDGGIAQLLVALGFLWIFGGSIEDSMSPWRFVLLYGAGFAAFGVSGAVATLLGGYALLYPRARVVTLSVIPFAATAIELPALPILALFLPVQALWERECLFQALAGSLIGMIVIKMLANRPHEDYA
ncbi:MAG: hypothetical protein H0T15_05155 [Thermoleophilaceae bacterium]|nr:hypothetical protein [Thermoleophilaceae bacterium]